MRATRLKTIMKPFLEGHPELAMRRRLIVLKPVRHVFRGVILERTSWTESTSPLYAVNGLFEYRDFVRLGWGEEYKWHRLAEPDHLKALHEMIEEDALPLIKKVESIADLYSYVDTHRARRYLFGIPSVKVVYDAALGDFDEAKKLAAGEIGWWSEENPKWSEHFKRKVAGLKSLHDRLMDNDVAGIATLLHEWEAYSVKAAGLEDIWEPTPFPFEE